MAPPSWARPRPPTYCGSSRSEWNGGPSTTEGHDGGGEMSRYLVVTHQTAFSPDLHRKVRELIAQDPAAEFAVLVPEAPGPTFTWEGQSPCRRSPTSCVCTLATTSSSSAHCPRAFPAG